MSVLDKPQLAGLAISKGYRRTIRVLNTVSTSLMGFSSLIPERIVLAPTDIRTADPMLALEFYHGRYVLGGKLVETGGKSPFIIGSQGEAWDRELHAFEWLRHLSASTDQLSPTHARVLIGDWIDLHRKSTSPTVWNLETASRRLIAWLCNSVLITSNAEHDFYRQFMRSLGAHVRFLLREVATAADGMPRLYAYIALAYASVCLEGQANSLEHTRTRLGQVLDHQIWPDGGHISRNPASIVDTLLLLLPLKHAILASQHELPAGMMQALDRMVPALRYFRLGDGHLARFNGTGYVEQDLLAAIMRLDDVAGAPLLDAVHSGYQRMAIGEAVLLMDTGDTPKGELSTEAHAGCLSFEFSYGPECIITNCGSPRFATSREKPAWRSSAAHSTAVLNDSSSCKFEASGTFGRYLGGQVYSANLKTESARDDGSDYSAISAAHHGYVRDFGIRHQRNLILDENGQRLSGNDWFSTATKGDLRNTTKDACTLHFHLAPEIKASRTSDGSSCLLQTRSGEEWIFSAPGFDVSLEESVFFAGIAGSVPTWQIVIRARVAKTPEIQWVLQRLQNA
jgi:uncharacterized heparinase superfamily protein